MKRYLVVHSILGPDDMQPIAERGAAGVLIRALPDLDADDLTYIGGCNYYLDTSLNKMDPVVKIRIQLP